MQRDSGRRAVVALGVAVAVAVVGGCSSRATVPDNDGTPTSDPVVFFFDGAVEGVTSDETITGTVMLVDRCVGLLADGAGAPQPCRVAARGAVGRRPRRRGDAERLGARRHGAHALPRPTAHPRGGDGEPLPEPPQECLDAAGSIIFLTLVDDIGTQE